MEEVKRENGTPSGSSPEKTPSEDNHQPSTDESNDLSSASKITEEEALEAIRKERERLLQEVTELRTERRTLKGQSSPESPDVPDKAQEKRGDPVSAAAERRALRIFMEKHPEYSDSNRWNQLQGTYVSRRSNVIWEDILDDYEDAHYLLNRENLIREEAKRTAGQAVAKVYEGSRADIGGTSSNPPEGSTPKEGLTEEEKKIFENLRKVDPSLTEEKYLERKKRLQK